MSKSSDDLRITNLDTLSFIDLRASFGPSKAEELNESYITIISSKENSSPCLNLAMENSKPFRKRVSKKFNRDVVKQ